MQILEHSDRLQLLETSVGKVIRFRKRRTMTKYQSLHFRVLDTPAYLLGCQIERKLTSNHRFDYFLLKIFFFIIY